MNTPHKRAGFTLIELIIVMALLGILIVSGLGSFTNSLQRGRDAKRKGDLQSLTKALALYYNDAGSFPLSNGGDIVGCMSGGALQSCSWGGVFQNSDASPPTVYASKLPTDPKGGAQYWYYSDGSSYALFARLENKEDSEIPRSGTSWSTNLVYTNIGGETPDCVGASTCDFVVVSPNLSVSSITTADDPAY